MGLTGVILSTYPSPGMTAGGGSLQRCLVVGPGGPATSALSDGSLRPGPISDNQRQGLGYNLQNLHF